MGLIGIEAASEDVKPWAARLAKSLKLNLLQPGRAASEPTPEASVKLVVSEIGLGLAFVDQELGKKPYYVDFTAGAWKQRFHAGLPKSHIFRKALGFRETGAGRVLDVTAGFGQDAMMILTLGVELTAIERSPVVFAVLEDGIRRAAREDETLKARLTNLKLLNVEALDYLAGLTADNAPDVIYLDPMFDKPKKKAKSPKEMQLLHALLGDPPSAEAELQLLKKALMVAKQRVVVKRPLKARAILASPVHTYKGQSVRYDVYLRRSSDFSVS